MRLQNLATCRAFSPSVAAQLELVTADGRIYLAMDEDHARNLLATFRSLKIAVTTRKVNHAKTRTEAISEVDPKQPRLFEADHAQDAIE